jgi:hypothetical protein
MKTTISRLLVCSTASIAALLVGGSAQAATQCNITFSNPTSLYNAADPSTDLCARSSVASNNVYSEVCGAKSVEISSDDSHFHLGMKNAAFACQPPSGGFSSLPCNFADPDGHGYGAWKWTAGGACPAGYQAGPNCVVPDWCSEARSVGPHDSSGEMYIYTNDFSFFNFQQIRLGQFSYTFANFPVSTNDITLYWWDSVNGYYQAVSLKAPPRGFGYYRFSNIYTDFIFIDNVDPSLPGFNIDDFTVTTY